MERLDAFMARANALYYATHDPFADFTTSPEISQAFGEVLGIWAAVTWESMGRPDPVLLVECGPGRGTLMDDALRAVTGVAAPFRAALRVHLVETSERLRRQQAERVLGAVWHDRIEDVPHGPAIILANEFLDALPIRQFVRRGEGWSERFVAERRWLERPLPPGQDRLWAASIAARIPGEQDEGSVVEVNEDACAIVEHVARRVVRDGGAALFIDYGPAESAPGESLQALKGGHPADPLSEPGTADLTAHVDFAALARVARDSGATAHGPMAQGLFLAHLGLMQRTGRLAQTQPPARAAALVQSAQRLVEPDRMGRLFKALAICHPGLPCPAGFFTRHGGVSTGPYASLNCSLSGQDAPEAVRENRARVARHIGAQPEALVGLTQVHGPAVAMVGAPWAYGAGPRADAMVTDRPGVALGIVTADCTPVLLADHDAHVIGAVHAGWRGAVAGVLEATVDAMVRLGAEPGRIAAAIGPCIRQGSYEVGADLRDAVLAHGLDDGGWFAPGIRDGHWQFDLAGYCRARLAGIGMVDVIDADTLADPGRFFSHRRRTLAGGGPIGHQISAIML